MDEHNAFDLAKLAIPTEPHQWQPKPSTYRDDPIRKVFACN
jgi:hypothetical protein